MKKTNDYRVKRDPMLVTILSLLIIVFFVVGSILTRSKGVSEVSELPDSYENLVGKLIISEVLTNNDGSYANEKGEACDFLEIYNGSSAAVNLDGYGLSDRTDRIKWAFSNTVIEPQQYLVVSLTGRLEDGFNADFRLSSKGGETVILTNARGKVIDAVETVSLSKGQVMARDGNGQWVTYDRATPGYPNSQEGLQQYVASLQSDEKPEVVINEILPRNNGNFVNEEGRREGYIELINVSEKTVDLSQYNVSNISSAPFRRQLDEVMLAPGETYVIYCGNVAADSRSPYTGFTLSSRNGEVVLSRGGRIIQTVSYSQLDNGMAYQRHENGSYLAEATISPGYPNTPRGVEQFQERFLVTPQDLIISEVMVRNYTQLPQNGNQYYDWIELCNNSNQTVSLSDYCLSNDDDYLSLYQLPNEQLAPGEYYVIMCSGDPALSNQSYHHAQFKLSDNESVFLSRAGSIVDSLYVANVPLGYSYGRGSKAGLFYMSSPSPLKPNQEGSRTITVTPVIKTLAGVYQGVEEVLVSIEGEGTIYYTTDGSRPTASSRVYTEPIILRSTTVLNVAGRQADALMSSVATSSFIINENNQLPVVSLSLSPGLLSTMHSHPHSTAEYQCNVEFFEEGGGFNSPCSISMFGGNTRNHDKHSYSLRFDGDYGASDLVYPVFDNRDNTVYDALVLRTGSNDWNKGIIRDELCTSLVDDYTDVTVLSYKTCVVYINGRYWGIYNIREKCNASFISDLYNVSKENTNIVRIDGEVKAGSRTEWQQIVSFARSHDLSLKANYDWICSKVDIQNLADYWICEMFVANPDVYNVRYFSNSELDGGKWKYIYYDLDCGFRNFTVNYYTRYLANPSGMTGFINNTYDNTIPRKLFANREFQQLWLERLNYHLRNTFSKANMQSRFDQLTGSIESEVARDRARWSATSLKVYRSHLSQIQKFINNRQTYVLNQTKAFFKLSDARMKEIFGDLW
ncbi:MAG: lamin tail domain-containing protein [Erysipelotrichaceae bacterium]|nr:lamin tail domain-containing protein [Erysipelotrichaceae bacterium]